MSVRARKDNVIYANFGGKTRVETPPPAEKRRTVGLSHQQAFIKEIYELRADSGRISRGIAYARNGNVVSFAVHRDRILASVAGSQNDPFTVAVVFPRRASDDMRALTTALLSEPGSLANARAGRLTPGMVTTLLADAPTDVRILCDCPDNSDCCKHGVAALEIFADKVGQSPAMLFDMRGLNFAQLERTMQEEARSRTASVNVDNEHFWDGGELPTLPSPKVAPAIDDADPDILHKAMRTVSYTAVEELRAVSDLEDLYDFLTRQQ
ncbi:hypothetical protein [Corynebacterium sp. H130]|uniref:hypothetical protein n=1 Tax=Corynebacterium sp. H130 TaxID=3133444 RepID=UPI0030B53842